MTKRIEKPKYKSYRSLGIPKKLHEALIWFVKSVERKTINGGKKKFNMSSVVDHECGTAACIGGWCAIHSLGLRPDKKGSYSLKEDNICDLFFKWCDKSRNIYELFCAFGYNMHDITVDVAHKVTRHYLLTGEVDYSKFMNTSK